MSDPYRILGVSPNASDDEVKTAYHSLAKKYHPDKYAGSPLADLAGEKMKEINEAYDQIMKERKDHANSSGQAGYGGYGEYSGYGEYGRSEYQDVRSLIMSGRIADAEQILDGVPSERRDAEWFFLKGTALYRRGWLDEAYNDYVRACQMNPQNPEYQAALNQVAAQRSGMYGGYNSNVPQANSCSGCDICTSLCVADTCCSCFGPGLGGRGGCW
ncbi:MAG TPA: molecular chaperone DnaJ [Ruminococcaceae bacterium]|jgi:curved DNA-binding protein CbpA|nr:molecular chaperone DnaJ [Oscillospiraceae bacterium]